MATQGAFITNNAWTDIVALFSLKLDNAYRLQNVSSHPLMIVKSATEPTQLEPFNLIMPKEFETIAPKEGIKIWLRSIQSINGAKAQIAITDDRTSVVKEVNGALPVNVQDQITRIIILKFNEVTNTTTLSTTGVKNTNTITVASTTGFVAGKYIILFHPPTKNFSFYTQIGPASGNIITLDTPLDFDYPIGTNADCSITNMAVDGSITPRIFGLRGMGSPPGVDIKVDFTRILFKCISSSAVDLTTFGGIPGGILNGFVCRKRDGIFQNIFNVKTNGDIEGGLLFDHRIHAATNPQQGVDGFSARLTFAGQEKIGVAIRLPIGEDMEIIIQDDLSVGNPTIDLLEIIAEGHLVQNSN